VTGNKNQRSFTFVRDFSSEVETQVSARLASINYLADCHKPAEWESGHVTCFSFTAQRCLRLKSPQRVSALQISESQDCQHSWYSMRESSQPDLGAIQIHLSSKSMPGSLNCHS